MANTFIVSTKTARTVTISITRDAGLYACGMIGFSTNQPLQTLISQSSSGAVSFTFSGLSPDTSYIVSVRLSSSKQTAQTGVGQEEIFWATNGGSQYYSVTTLPLYTVKVNWSKENWTGTGWQHATDGTSFTYTNVEPGSILDLGSQINDDYWTWSSKNGVNRYQTINSNREFTVYLDRISRTYTFTTLPADLDDDIGLSNYSGSYKDTYPITVRASSGLVVGDNVYSFAGWFKGSTIYSSSIELSIIASAANAGTYRAKYELKHKASAGIVSGCENMFSSVSVSPTHVLSNETVTWTAQMINSGYGFVGWYGNSSGTGTAVSTSITYPTTISKDTIYYAKGKPLRKYFSWANTSLSLTKPSDSPIAVGAKLSDYLTAAKWNLLQDNIKEVGGYKGITVQVSKVNVGDTLTAALYNNCAADIEAIGGSSIARVTADSTNVSAAIFNTLQNTLNAITV